MTTLASIQTAREKEEDYSTCSRVDGAVNVLTATALSLPSCTSIGGLVSVYAHATADLSSCITVEGPFSAYSNAAVDLSSCVSVGGLVNIEKGAKVDLSSCSLIRGSLSVHGAGTHEFPSCIEIGDYVYADAGTTLKLPTCASIKRAVYVYEGAVVEFAPHAKVGGSVNLFRGAELNLFLPTCGSPRIFLNESLHEKYATQWGDKITVRNVDGITMAMVRTRAIGEYIVHSARYLSGHAIQDMRPCFVVEQGNVTTHGETIDKAIRDLRFKIDSGNHDPEETVEQVKRNGFITWHDFRLLTGACEHGLEQGLISLGLPGDTEKLPLAQAMELVKGQYGEGRMKELFGEETT